LNYAGFGRDERELMERDSGIDRRFALRSDPALIPRPAIFPPAHSLRDGIKDATTVADHCQYRPARRLF